MFYETKTKRIEAFKLGSDNLPDWFMNEVNANNIILHPIIEHPIWISSAEFKFTEPSYHVASGNYIVRDENGKIYHCTFEELHREYNPVIFTGDTTYVLKIPEIKPTTDIVHNNDDTEQYIQQIGLPKIFYRLGDDNPPEWFTSMCVIVNSKQGDDLNDYYEVITDDKTIKAPIGTVVFRYNNEIIFLPPSDNRIPTFRF